MAEANWYVVHTYSGYENKVKVDIEKMVENRGLEKEILEVAVPLEDVTEIRDGEKKQVKRKRFPGYVLVNMVMNDDTWYVVRNTVGVTGFVGPGSKPIPLSPEEMENMLAETSSVEIDFEIGDTVEISEEGFEGMQAVVKAIDKEEQKVTVLVDLLGPNTTLEVGFTAIKKI